MALTSFNRHPTPTDLRTFGRLLVRKSFEVVGQERYTIGGRQAVNLGVQQSRDLAFFHAIK